MVEKVNISEKFTKFNDYWNPRVIGELNGSEVKATKLKGEFMWHTHDEEDEMFLVVKGNLLIRLRDKNIQVGEGEFVVIPKGVEHLPVATEEVHVLLFEPKGTLNTGNVVNERTVSNPEQI